jgi:hypothetical protein
VACESIQCFPTIMEETPFEDLVMVKKQVAPRTNPIQGGMWPCAMWKQSRKQLKESTN